MNTVHSSQHESLKAPTNDAKNDEETASVFSQLPISPTLMTRYFPGQATPANSDPSSSNSSLNLSSSHASLLRFIDSSVFTVHHAIYYLFESPSEIWEHLGKRLFAFRTHEVEFYLPQLLALFLRCEEGSRCLLPYLSFRVHSSPRFATRLTWHLETYLASSKSSPSSSSNSSKPIAHSTISVSLKLDPLLSIPSSSSVATTAKVEVIQGLGQESATQDDDREEESSSSLGSLNCQEGNEDTNGVVDDSEEGVTSQKNGSSESETNESLNFASLHAGKNDHLAKHKRAISDLTCKLAGQKSAQVLVKDVPFYLCLIKIVD